MTANIQQCKEQEALALIRKDYCRGSKEIGCYLENDKWEKVMCSFDTLQQAIDRLGLVEKENKKLKDENFRLYKELAEAQNVSISSARGNFLYRYRKELENGK